MQIELRSIDEQKPSFKSTFEFEDGKLIQVQKAISDGDKDSRIERHIDGDDKLIIVSYRFPILYARVSIFRCARVEVLSALDSINDNRSYCSLVDMLPITTVKIKTFYKFNFRCFYKVK